MPAPKTNWATAKNARYQSVRRTPMESLLMPALPNESYSPHRARCGSVSGGLMDRGFDALRGSYGWSLGLVLRHRVVMMALFVAVLWATMHMFGVVPKGFIPESDNDTLNVSIRAAQGTSFYDMVKYVERVAEFINRNPNVDAMMVNTGSGGAGMNSGRMSIQLTPRATRTLTASQIAQQLRGPLGHYPAFQSFVNVPAVLQIGGFQGNSNYNLMVERDRKSVV